MKASEILRGAMGHVEKGWHQGGLYGPDGSVCMVGGLAMATGQQLGRPADPHYRCAADTLYRTVKDQFGFCGMGAFNDDPDTSKADVLVAMEKAAISLEERGQ